MNFIFIYQVQFQLFLFNLIVYFEYFPKQQHMFFIFCFRKMNITFQRLLRIFFQVTTILVFFFYLLWQVNKDQSLEATLNIFIPNQKQTNNNLIEQTQKDDFENTCSQCLDTMMISIPISSYFKLCFKGRRERLEVFLEMMIFIFFFLFHFLYSFNQ